jgi:hypothetical protein
LNSVNESIDRVIIPIRSDFSAKRRLIVGMDKKMIPEADEIPEYKNGIGFFENLGFSQENRSRIQLFPD